MVAGTDHPILLRGLDLHAEGDARPSLVQRSEIKFLDGLLADLREGGSFPRLAARSAGQGAALAPALSYRQGRQQLLLKARLAAVTAPVKLYQPVHRTFPFAVLEAACDLFPELGRAGQPKLDRTMIESAGLVVRRVDAQTGVAEGWLTDGVGLRGWVPLNEGDLGEDLDPDPRRRPRRLGTGIPELDAQLGLDRRPAATLSEQVEPLFVAPPDVCAAAGRTLLYGMIPTVSLEHTEAPAETLPPPRLDLATMRQLFADYLTPEGGIRAVPLRIDPLGVDFYQAQLLEKSAGDTFLSLLRWLNELDALEHPAAITALNGVTARLALDPETSGLTLAAPFERVTIRDTRGLVRDDFIQVRLGDLALTAATALRDSEVDLTTRATAPSGYTLGWQIPDAAISDAALGALSDRMQQRTIEFKLLAGERRFDPRRGRYVARAFIRVRREPGCPPRIWWSAYSEVFQIAQHWDHNPDVPPTIIPMPGLPTRDALKAMKPNVAFEVPESLQNFLDANGMQNFLDGDASKGKGGLDILWICSFSIQIIMMIAFTILIIFAILLNIVFNWLIFIRICLPIPVPKGE